MRTVFLKKGFILLAISVLALTVSAEATIKISSGEHEFAIGGRLMLDLDYYDGAFNKGKGGGIVSEYEVRRSRLSLNGQTNEV